MCSGYAEIGRISFRTWVHEFGRILWVKCCSVDRRKGDRLLTSVAGIGEQTNVIVEGCQGEIGKMHAHLSTKEELGAMERGVREGPLVDRLWEGETAEGYVDVRKAASMID